MVRSSAESHDASAANLRLAARLEEHTMHIARLQHALTMQSAEKQAVAASLSADLARSDEELQKAQRSIQALWTSRRALVDEITTLRERIRELERNAGEPPQRPNPHGSSHYGFSAREPLPTVIHRHLSLAAAVAEDLVEQRTAEATSSLRSALAASPPPLMCSLADCSTGVSSGASRRPSALQFADFAAATSMASRHASAPAPRCSSMCMPPAPPAPAPAPAPAPVTAPAASACSPPRAKSATSSLLASPRSPAGGIAVSQSAACKAGLEELLDSEIALADERLRKLLNSASRERQRDA